MFLDPPSLVEEAVGKKVRSADCDLVPEAHEESVLYQSSFYALGV